MPNYQPHTFAWMAEADAGSKPFCAGYDHGVRIVSLVTDANFAPAANVQADGFAYWRFVNEALTNRARTINLTARAAHQHVAWDPAESPNAQGDLERSVTVRGTHRDAPTYEETDLTGRFQVRRGGAESIVTDIRRKALLLESKFTACVANSVPGSAPHSPGPTPAVGAPTPEHVEQALRQIGEGAAEPGCKLMAVNKLSPDREGLYGAEAFMGDWGGFTSGQLFAAATDEQAVQLDLAASRAIVAGFESGWDFRGEPIPTLERLSVNLSLELLQSKHLLEAVQTYRDGIGGTRVVFELPEGMGADGDLDQAILLTNHVPDIQLAIDDAYGLGTFGSDVHVARLRDHLVWFKFDHKFFRTMRQKTALKQVLVERMTKHGCQCLVVVEGIESGKDRDFIREQITPADLQVHVVGLQGFDVSFQV